MIQTISAWNDTPTHTLNVGGTSFAYRQLGPRGATPLVFLHHFTAVLDDWDPEIIDPIAEQRHVITFDNRGVGASDGKTPHTIAAMAADAAAFIRALRHDHVDLLGFSLGGGVAQEVTLQSPDLVRRLILTGTGHRGGGGLAKMPLIVGGAYTKAALTRLDPRQFLFFNRVMVGSSQSYVLAEQIPNSKLVIYPDSGHGGIFQHRDRFVPAVLEFLEADDPIAVA